MYTYEEVLKTTTEYFNGDDLAAKVWVDKYELRDNDGNILEKTPSDMHRRLAKEFARIEKNKYDARSFINSEDEFDSKFKHPLSEELIFKLFDNFRYIIPQGSPAFGIGNNYQIVSLSNCYVLETPQDSYNSILDTDKQLVNISKRRGGVGIDLSNLRPAGSKTNNAAKTSTGIISWMERFSNSIREVGQNARRGALMLTLDVHHPDISAFATVKNDDTKVTGANISVKLSKEFLDALKNNTDYELRFPVNSKKPTISKMISAKKIWDVIINSAWLRAEPGLLMWDNILKGPADCYETYKSKSTNPCARGNTKILTKNGEYELKHIENQIVEVWNGSQWSKVQILKTGINKQLWLINCSKIFCGKNNIPLMGINSIDLFVTENHKFYLQDGRVLSTKNISPKDELLTFIDDKGYMVKCTINSITKTNIYEDVFCCTEPLEHKIVLNGILTGQCAEISLSELDSCRLICMNLYSYVKNPFTTNAEFDFTRFYLHSKIAQRLMDNLVDLESEKIDKILEKIDSDPEEEKTKENERAMWIKIKQFNNEGRRTGLGPTAVGDALAALNIKYGSDKSIDEVENIYKCLKLGAYRSSVEMSKLLGPFKDWDYNKEKHCEFLNRIKEEDISLFNDMKKYGRRNIALLTTAPTGTVSTLTQTSSGIEPAFMLSYIRRKKINPGDKNIKIDFTDQNGDKWQEFTVYHHKLKDWMDITKETDITKSPWYNACAEDIDWINRVKLQAAAQKHVCHAISSTINLPENVSVDEVKKIYETAYEMGCKGITIYRKNCRTGVLVENGKNQIKYNDSPKRPKILNCNVCHLTRGGQPYFVLVGLLEDSSIYEVFAGKNNNDTIHKNVKKGKIIKKGRGKYKVEFDDGSEISPVSAFIDSSEESVTRLISSSLRHGMKINHLVEQLEKDKGDMNSLIKIIARALKTYINDGTKVSGSNCPECNEELRRMEGCQLCPSCGWSKC